MIHFAGIQQGQQLLQLHTTQVWLAAAEPTPEHACRHPSCCHCCRRCHCRCCSSVVSVPAPAPVPILIVTTALVVSAGQQHKQHNIQVLGHPNI
jgi:hypothetical protein